MADTSNNLKIYTKAGDGGTTTIGASSERIFKSEQVIRAIGAIDELNAAMGGLRKFNDDPIIEIQTALFQVGSMLSSNNYEEFPPLDDLTSDLEARIDKASADLPPLRNFIYPVYQTADIHTARAICRRAETEITQLDKLSPSVMKFINRLSDYLFILTRVYGSVDEKWTPRRAESAALRGRGAQHLIKGGPPGRQVFERSNACGRFKYAMIAAIMCALTGALIMQV